MSNRPGFHVADTAAMHLGAATFSIYPIVTVGQAEHVIADSGARMLVTEQRDLKSAREVRARANAALETIVVDAPAAADAMGWAELSHLGWNRFDLESCAAAVRPDDLMTLVTPPAPQARRRASSSPTQTRWPSWRRSDRCCARCARVLFSPPRLWEKLRTGILTRNAHVVDDVAATAMARARSGLTACSSQSSARLRAPAT